MCFHPLFHCVLFSNSCPPPRQLQHPTAQGQCHRSSGRSVIISTEWKGNKCHTFNSRRGRLRWAGHVEHMEQSRKTYRVLVGKPEGKRLLWKPRCRREDNIEMDFREVGFDTGDWLDLAKDRDQWRAYVRAQLTFGFLKSQLVS